jgi:hypothetical protein
MMTKTSKTSRFPVPLLSVALFTALSSTGCSTTPDAPAADDQLVLQVCLRDKQMAKTPQLDFTIVRADKRDIEPTMPIGKSVKNQPIFETVASDYASIKTSLLSLDRITWYGFDLSPESAPHLGVWSDWQPASYVSRTEDAAYRLQHDLGIDRQTAGASPNAVKIRYTMMHYKDMLATRASRRIELARTDFPPC